MAWQDYLRDEMIDANVVVGTDSNNYVCILNHRSKTTNRPITGVDWATYWALTTDFVGSAWVVDTNYHIRQDASELNGLVDSVASVNSSITHWTHWRDVYQGIQGVCKSNNESRLAVKQAAFMSGIPVWQASHLYNSGDTIQPTIANGYTYEAGFVFSAWSPNTAFGAGAIISAGGYLYSSSGGVSDIIEPVWPGFIGGSVFDFTITWTCTAVAPTSGTSGGVEPVWPVVVGNTVLDNTITWTCRAGYTINYGGTYNVSNISDWAIRNPAGANVYVYGGVGWDSDAIITKAITDWGIMYPLLTNTTSGALAMITNLGNALVIVTAWKNNISARNPILTDYD